MTTLSASRRQFLRALGISAAALPGLALPGFMARAGAAPGAGHILVLIELAGGNDGLNTVIPIRDPAYRALRPDLGITTKAAIGLDAETALNPGLRPLADLWRKGQVRIIEGVGYPEPNRSHFRSIEIWNTGGGARSLSATGWIAAALGRRPPGATQDVDGVVLGGEMGPLAGPGRFTVMRNPDRFVARARRLAAVSGGEARAVTAAASSDGAPSPLEQVLAVYESAAATSEKIRVKLARLAPKAWDFPESELGQQLHAAARLLDAGVTVPALKVTLGGFDTHANQAGSHEMLLQDLSQSVTAFARQARRMGLWDRIVMVTYSEFGRRARQNRSAGTDHGTAQPVLVIGGRVRGGIGGKRPSLDQLVEDDLVHTTDYRALYAGILADLWGRRDNVYSRAGHTPIPLLKA